MAIGEIRGPKDVLDAHAFNFPVVTKFMNNWFRRYIGGEGDDGGSQSDALDTRGSILCHQSNTGAKTGGDAEHDGTVSGLTGAREDYTPQTHDMAPFHCVTFMLGCCGLQSDILVFFALVSIVLLGYGVSLYVVIFPHRGWDSETVGDLLFRYAVQAVLEQSIAQPRGVWVRSSVGVETH